MPRPGDQLLSVLDATTSHCVLVAPYIQAPTLGAVLERLPGAVSVSVLTRWQTADLVSGVSDPDVWLLLKERGAGLFLRGNLHAKYYRADDACLIGSANLTQTGLGWSSPPNAELLWRLAPVPQALLEAEAAWFAHAQRVDDSLYERARVLAQSVPRRMRVAGERAPASALGWWWPRLRAPGDLWAVYTGKELPPSSQVAGDADLAALGLPDGLSRAAFDQAVAHELQQALAVAWVDAGLSRPRRFGEMRDTIRQLFERYGETRSADEAWQTMVRWLLHYLPARYIYRRPRQTEILERVHYDSDE